MKVILNKITGIDDAIVAMFISRRTLTPELETDIRRTIRQTNLLLHPLPKKVEDWLTKLVKWGTKHMTLLRYVNISATVYGLHRGGQDDFDSHAMRLNNRIVRSSTRLAEFGDEVSEFYEGKILPLSKALEHLGIEIPETMTYLDSEYVKTTNGYIRADFAKNQDVKRGLYMLSIPSNFLFNVQLTELAHIYKERGAHGTAHPELKKCVESLADQLEIESGRVFTRQLLLDIPN